MHLLSPKKNSIYCLVLFSFQIILFYFIFFKSSIKKLYRLYMELKSNNSNYTKILIDEKKFQAYNKNMKRLMFNINNKTKNINLDNLIVIYSETS